VLLSESKKNPNPKWRGENTLSRIKRRSRIRVGFYTKSGPFSYFNADSVLVGYGIDIAHQLATDLEVDIEFVPVPPGELTDNLNRDHFDIFVSDVFLSGQYAEKMLLSKPYMSVSLALLTRQDNKMFDDYKNTAALDTFTISYLERKEIAGDFLSYFPEGGAYPIREIPEFFDIEKNGLAVIDSISKDSITIDSIRIQAHLTSAERASFLTIKYPGYKVRNPLPYHVNNSLVFPLARDDAWRIYINRWIDFREQDGSLERIYDQWILGEPHQKEQEPWSIYKNIVKPWFESEKDS
jgi:ABC-type amino acid transport substrate-binding protein